MIIYRPFQILLNAVTKGYRSAINFIAGTNITLVVADNAAQDRVDVTIASTGVIGSTPSSGEYQVVGIRLDASKKIILTYNDTPEP